MEWCVYVGQKAAENYRIGMASGVWGQKNVFSSSRMRDVKAGDRVYFFHNIVRQIPPVGQEKKGNLRLAQEHYERLGGFAQHVTICKVTTDYYHDDSEVWADATYPHRYGIEVVEQLENVLIGVEVQGEAFIRALLRSITTKGDAIPLDGEAVSLNGGYVQEDESQESAEEGRPLFKLHLKRERDSGLVKKKKQQAMANGELKCEACGLDFAKMYGEHVKGFIECHHDTPLFERIANETTSLDDLTLLCSNCHRMIHRRKRWLTVEELKGMIAE